MQPGFVSIVGAGPGDPNLITLAATNRLGMADVILFDRLVNGKILDFSKPNAELLNVGKIPNENQNDQDYINDLMMKNAIMGKFVVRLKGGDPFVFGRGGEEAEFLRANCIPFEIVPGITSAVAVPAYSGIPITYRGIASVVTVVTGNEDPSKISTDVKWDLLAQQNGTIVVMMGLQNISRIVEVLIKNGRSPNTPIAITENGSLPNQRTVVGTLADIVSIVSRETIHSPVIIVIGDVVNFIENIRWFDRKILSGRKILITRASNQASRLSELLNQLGANTVELPTIEVRHVENDSYLDKALYDLKKYQWIIFASVNAVESVFGRLYEMGQDARCLANSKVVAIGQGTAEILRTKGIVADVVPREFHSQGLIGALKDQGIDSSRILLPQGDISPDNLIQAFNKLGAVVERVVAYNTVTPNLTSAYVKNIFNKGIDVATFTSSSTVRNLILSINKDISVLSGVTIACIGPVTASTAKEFGLDVEIVAKEHTISGLVRAIEEYYS